MNKSTKVASPLIRNLLLGAFFIAGAAQRAGADVAYHATTTGSISVFSSSDTTTYRPVNANALFEIDDTVVLTLGQDITVPGNGIAGGGAMFRVNTTGSYSYVIAPTSGAAAGSGSAILQGNRAGNNYGAAMFISAGTTTVKMTNVTVQGFSQGTNGTNVPLSGGAIVNHPTSTVYYDFNNVIFQNNYIGRNNSGGGLTNYGAAMFVTGSLSTLTINTGTFASNVSSGTGINNATGGGGAIYSRELASISMKNVVFASNTLNLANAMTATTGNATTYGGAFMMTSANGPVKLEGVKFKDNTNNLLQTFGYARALGGAVYAATMKNNTLTLNNVTFEGNKASASAPGTTASVSAWGGALYLDNGVLSGSNVVFSENTVSGGVSGNNSFNIHGGALYLATGVTGTITSGTFINNAANGTNAGGGAMTLTNSSNLTLTDAVFANNTSANIGGAIEVNNGTLTLNITQSATYTGNQALGNGASADPTKGGFLSISNAASVVNINAAASSTLVIGADSAVDADTIYGADAGQQININTAAGNTGDIVLHGNSAANLATTNILAGRLLLGNGNTALGGGITVGNGATLGGIGSLSHATGTVTLDAGSTLRIGLGHTAPETLNIAGSLILGGGAFLDYGIYGNNNSDLLTIRGAITQDTTASTIIISDTTLGKYALINVLGAAGLTTLNFDTTLLNVSYNNTPYAPSDYSFVINENFLYLILGNPVNNNVITWTGLVNGSWTGANWTTFSTGTTFTQDDIINLDGANTANNTITIDTTTAASVAGMYVSGNQNYTITGTTIAAATIGSLTGSAAATGKLILGAKATDDAGTLTTVAYTGTLTLNNNANTFQGGIEIKTGHLIGNAKTLGAGPPGILNDATLTFDQATDDTYASAISGNGQLNKTNIGNLSLTADNSAFTGATNIAAGTLTLGGPGGKLGGDITLDTGANFGGAGTALGNVTTTGGNIITIGETTATESLTIGGILTLANNTTLHYTTDTGNLASLLNIGALARAGTSTIDISNAISGTYHLIHSTAALAPTDTASLLTTLNGGNLSGRTTTTYTIPNTTDLYLTILSSNLTGLKWNGATDGTWDQSTDNWLGLDTKFLDGDSITFDDTATGSHNITLDTAITAADITIDTAATYTIAGPGALTTSTLGTTLTGAINGALLKQGPGALILANTGGNDFQGGITVNSGTLVSGAGNALGATAATLNLAPNTTLNLAGHTQTLANLTAAAHATIALGAATGALTIAAGGLNTVTTTTIALDGGNLTLNGGSHAGALAGPGTLNLASGTTTLATANTTLTADTTIAAGAAAILGDTAALGTGAIHLAAASSSLTLDTTAASSSLTLGTTATGDFANTLDGAGTLTTTGDITITNANTGYTGATHINAGRLTAAAAAALGTGAITIAADASLDYTAAGTIANTIDGAGTLNLAAATGTLTLAAASSIANINARDGAIILAANVASLGTGNTRLGITDATVILGQTGMALGDVTLAGTGRLAFAITTATTFKTATLKSLASTGDAATLTFNTNANQRKSDTLAITGAITGTYTIAIHNTGDAPNTRTLSFNLITAAAGNPTYNLELDTISFGGMTSYDITALENGSGITFQFDRSEQLSPLGGYVVNTVGAVPLTWYSELDTISKRMGEIRLDARDAPGADLWARAYTHRLDVNSRATGIAYTDNQYGMDVGLDYGGRQSDGKTTCLGAFLGYGGSSRDIDNTIGDGHTGSIYGGLYLTMMTAGEWYADIVLKYNGFTNDYTTFDASENIKSHYRSTGWGASAEIGKRIQLTEVWHIIPQVQAAIADFYSNGYITSNNMKVSITSGRATQLRAGIQTGYDKILRNGRTLSPYAKLSGVWQQSSGNQVKVDNHLYDTAIEGGRFDAGLGVNWTLGKGFRLYADYEFAWAETYIKPYGLTLGIHCEW
jgi:outer membrane autotransporter protein